MKHVLLEEISLNQFEALIGSRFSAQTSGGPVDLELREVARSRVSRSDAGGYESFSLIFLGAVNTPLPQGMHRLSNAQLDDFDLFLVPIARKQEGIQYEAVFNRKAGGKL